jgi:hypothetical protein
MCHLQGLWTKYKSKGLVILGFDEADDKQIALEMLRQNGATFPNIVDSSDAAEKVCFQQYQGGYGSAVPMSYIIDRDGKIVDAWYGYEEGHSRAMATLKKLGGSLAEAIGRDMDAKFAKSAEEVAIAAHRLFKAIRAADYDHDWIGTKDWEHFPAKDAAYYRTRNQSGWVRWVCKKFKANPITDVQLGRVFSGPDGKPTLHFALRLKDGETLQGDLPFKWDSERKQWIGFTGLDWHLHSNPWADWWNDFNRRNRK